MKAFLLIAFFLAIIALSMASEAIDKAATTDNFQDAEDHADLRVTPRIVNGFQIASGKYPWMVELTIGTGGSASRCGGSIIGAYHVLTAAHCVIGEAANAVEAVSDCVDLDNCGGASQELTSNAIYIHEDYDNNNFDNDVAIVKFGTAWTAAPVKLIDNSLKYLICGGTPVTTMGYGTTSQGGSTSQDLLGVNLFMFNRPVCQEIMGSAVSDSMICAGQLGENKDSCQGDSGGPLIALDISLNPVLVGDVSWGDGCARSDKLGVYGDILKFKKGIDSILAGGTEFIAGGDEDPSCYDVSSSTSNDEGVCCS